MWLEYCEGTSVLASNLQEEDRGEDVRLRISESLEHVFVFEVLGKPDVVAFDGLEKPVPLALGEERCVFGILRRRRVRAGSARKVERLTSCMQK